jgi:hypothetical protein
MAQQVAQHGLFEEEVGWFFGKSFRHLALADKMRVLKRGIARAGFRPGFFHAYVAYELSPVCRRPRPRRLKRRK